ncbi:major facilitator superfamily domain-containing protein [Lipomyces arxii]|uniref:major facilitator superfamily domain-containing protein n=1 Tax=Lipomyces arxii TaxID=56418 RepID=UPI0034CE4591
MAVNQLAYEEPSIAREEATPLLKNSNSVEIDTLPGFPSGLSVIERENGLTILRSLEEGDDDGNGDDNMDPVMAGRGRSHDRWNSPPINKYRVLTTFVGFIMLGMNDAAPGPLLLYIEDYYQQSYTVISLCFLAPAVGYMVAAFCNASIHVHLGRGGTSTLAMTLITIGYIILSCAPPLQYVVLAYGICGLGNGTLDAAWNAYVGDLQDANEILGIMHGCYGFGGIISPLVATAMVTSGIQWNKFYYVMIAYSITMVISVTLVFRGENGAKYTADHPEGTDEEGNTQGLLSEALKNKYTFLMAFFLFCYMGAEVGLGAWIVPLMVRERNGDPAKMGAVASGFWGGITVGRVALGFVTGRIGENTMATVYLILSIAFQLLFWLSPTIIPAAIGVAFVGVFFGPLFPTAMIALTKLLPKRLHVTGIGFAASFGGAGSAVFPFITGALAETHGPKVLLPLVLTLILCMTVIWVALPSFETTGIRNKIIKMLKK